jgi:hypothetical protein
MRSIKKSSFLLRLLGAQRRVLRIDDRNISLKIVQIFPGMRDAVTKVEAKKLLENSEPIIAIGDGVGIPKSW